MDRGKNLLVKIILGISLISVYGFLIFGLYVLLETVPEYMLYFEAFGGPLSFITQVIITLSYFVREHFVLLIIFLLLPASIFWFGFVISSKKKKSLIIVNGALSAILLFLILIAHVALQLPLYHINKIRSMSGEKPISFLDVKEVLETQRALSFTIAANKNVYTRGEAIVMTYNLTNISQNKQLINNIIAPGGNLIFHVENRQNYQRREEPEMFYEHAFWQTPGKENLVWLEPSASLDGQVELSSQQLSATTYNIVAMLLMCGTVKNLAFFDVMSNWMTIEIVE